MPDDPAREAPEAPWNNLLELMPEAHGLSPAQRSHLLGFLRRGLVQAREERDATQNLFRLEDMPALVRLVRDLPLFDTEAVAGYTAELALTPEEATAETANWAFRHQSLRGEVLCAERLVPVRLIRLAEEAYLCLALDPPELLAEALRGAFGREADVYSGSALEIAGEPWRAWAWFTHPDREQAARAAEQLRGLWRESIP